MSRSRGSGKHPRGRQGQQRASGDGPADLPRAQVDVLLERIAEEARECLRANPDDPAVFQRVVDRTRELLRVTALEHHVHIGDAAQHLIEELGEDADHAAGPDIAVRNADLMQAEPLGEVSVEGPGLDLAEDPFDVDAYAPAEEQAAPSTEMVEPAVDEEPGEPPAPGAPPSAGKERRHDADGPSLVELRRGLTDRQLATLDTMVNFGWTLRFVRRPMFQPPIPVVFDRNRKRFVVIEADGSVDEDPGLQIRD